MKTVAAAALAAVLSACGGGGGGGGNPEATVASVSAPVLLEADSGTSELQFVVTLSKPAVNQLRFQYSTASTAKAGGGTTGSATGGAACGAGVDYVNETNTEVLVPAGSTTGILRVTVCGDTVFEPLETVRLDWALNGASGSAIGTILNNDAGGLNGTGVAGSFGRDSQPLTNSDADGRLGFSFANVANAAPAGGNCIRDNVTGLLWEPQSATGGNLHDAAATYTWANRGNHVTAVNAANTCGFSNWRVPTPEELASVVDNGTTTTPTVDTTFFSNQAATPYWTETTYRDGSNANAWFVDFATGTVSLQNKASAYRLRLVSDGGFTNATARAASCTDAGRYTVHSDGTVTDRRTGLMWKQCAEGQSGAACSTGTAVALDFTAALARPAAISGDLGYTDWRLPTRAELSSITEREQCDQQAGTNPSIVSSVFPNTGAVDYWTQTPYAFNGTLAWRINFADGEVAPATKTGGPSSAKRVRLVRAGQ